MAHAKVRHPEPDSSRPRAPLAPGVPDDCGQLLGARCRLGAGLRQGSALDRGGGSRHYALVPRSDELTTAILAACDEIFDKHFDRLWTDRRMEFEVSPGLRRDRRRRVTTQGIELVGYATGDDNEWPGYFEPVRERHWFGGEWVVLQSVEDAARRIEDRLLQWASGTSDDH